jgi:hypothetical protein
MKTLEQENIETNRKCNAFRDAFNKIQTASIGDAFTLDALDKKSIVTLTAWHCLKEPVFYMRTRIDALPIFSKNGKRLSSNTFSYFWDNILDKRGNYLY